MSYMTISPRQSSDRESCLQQLIAFPTMSGEEQVNSLATLLRCSDRGIGKRALAIAAVVLSDGEVMTCLRHSADDVVRNAGLEILMLRARNGSPLAFRLLEDSDSHVVLQAVLAIDNTGDPCALGGLRRVLRHSDPNVVQAAIVSIGHCADARALKDLVPFLERESWLQMAAVQALGDLRAPRALDHLTPLLGDLVVGPMAAEAIARIGGEEAFAILADQWLANGGKPGGLLPVKLLAHVAEGLVSFPVPPEGLRTRLVEFLAHPASAGTSEAAACILALGPGLGDLRSVGVLARARAGASELPDCLANRSDLTVHLLWLSGVARGWGLQLAGRLRGEATLHDLDQALQNEPQPELLGDVAAVLEQSDDPGAAAMAYDLFFRLQPWDRSEIAPAIRRWGRRIKETLDREDNVGIVDRVVLEAYISKKGDHALPAHVTDLCEEDRASVVAQLRGCSDVLRQLPWNAWLNDDLESNSRLLASVIEAHDLHELLPLLRRAVCRQPENEAIRALGKLGDRTSVPMLIEHLEQSPQMTRALILDTLGHLGGDEVREALKSHIETAEAREAHIALAALARCAVDEDMQLFRNAVHERDGAVREICADALGRFPSRENLDCLVNLAADPQFAVARRAMVALERAGGLS